MLEVLSLAGEITAGMKAAVKKNADELLKHEDEIFKTAKNADEAGELDELFAILDDLSVADAMAKPAKAGNFGGKVLKASQIRKLRGQLAKKGIALLREEDILLSKLGKVRNNQLLKNYRPIILQGFKFDTLPDLIGFMKRENFAGAFDAKTRQLILTENPTEYLVFHEMAHLKQFEEIGDAYYKLMPWQRETYVYLEIKKSGYLFSAEELKHALKYVNQERKAAGQSLLK